MLWNNEELQNFFKENNLSEFLENLKKSRLNGKYFMDQEEEDLKPLFTKDEVKLKKIFNLIKLMKDFTDY